MPKVDVNKKRNDPNAQIDLETFWQEGDDLKNDKIVNFTGDWDQDFGHVRYRYQDIENDTIIPIGRLSDGRYGISNLSIDLNLLAVGSAVSGLGVFRRSTLAHLTKTRTPEQLRIVIIDPIRSLSDFYNIPHLVVPRAVTKEEINVVLEWILKENERRNQICEEVNDLLYIHNENVSDDKKEPKLLILVSELGEIGIEDAEIQGVFTNVLSTARATEINTILCTQQFSSMRLPSAILENIYTKLAFQLPYRETSEKVIGKAGAEELLGQGDAIFTNGSQYWRLQGFHF